MKQKTFEKLQEKEDGWGQLIINNWHKNKGEPGTIHYGWVKIDGRIYKLKTFGFHDGKKWEMAIVEVREEREKDLQEKLPKKKRPLMAPNINGDMVRADGMPIESE